MRRLLITAALLTSLVSAGSIATSAAHAGHHDTPAAVATPTEVTAATADYFQPAATVTQAPASQLHQAASLPGSTIGTGFNQTATGTLSLQ